MHRIPDTGCACPSAAPAPSRAGSMWGFRELLCGGKRFIPLCSCLLTYLLFTPAAGQQEPLGHFLKRLTDAAPAEAAAMLDGMADINAATPREHITALHAAVAYNRLDILHLLLQRGAQTELLMKPGLTPLSAAAMKNDTDAISLLLKHGAQLNHHTAGGVSALKLACAKGNLDAAQVLLAHGADPVPADAEGHTALTLAQEHAGEARVPLMRMLLEHGANPDGRVGEDGWSPLMTAVVSHDISAAELLLEHGAAVDTTGEAGSTPLMMAAGYGYATLVEHLLERGASITRQDGDGNDALDHAALGARFTHGISAAACGEEPGVQNEAMVDSGATCRLLLQRGANVHHVDASGSTPLIIAARVGEPENVRLLLEHGADVNARNHEGHTALISALLPTSEKVRLTFSPTTVEARQRTIEHITPLFEKFSRIEQTVRLLLEAGADSSLRDASGRSAFDYASTPELKALLIQGPMQASAP